ncbi:putative nuclease HARBI1 [Trichonephila clavipes]|nr:putative nuclease HARBI1 [Trichonephila clavipes]
MDVSTFEELVALVSPSIERKNTSMRKAIPAAERIALTLRYLATGSEMRVPESGNEWKMVAEEFWAKWNFPLCLCAMDGYIRIKPPLSFRSNIQKLQGFFSIVLLALVDANLKFLYVDVGTNGRASEAYGEI